MPHADLKYSPDLSFDPQAMFTAIEQTILAHDSGSGDCKCRSYPAEASNHTHLLIEISMLSKPHRDEAFHAQPARRNRSRGQMSPETKLLYIPGYHIFRRHVSHRPHIFDQAPTVLTYWKMAQQSDKLRLQACRMRAEINRADNSRV